MTNLVPLPVMLTFFGAAITLLFPRRPRIQRAISVAALVAVAALAVVFMVHTDQHGALVLWLGDWPTPLGIVLVADRLSALMLLVASIVAVSVLLFSAGQDRSELRRETPVSIFHPTFLLLMAGIANAFLAGDLFNLFVGFEIFLFSSYVLLTLGGTKERIRAGTTYVVVSLLSSTLFLASLAAVYAATGTVNMAQLSVRLAELSSPVQLLLQGMLLTTFSIKAAVFPLFSWLPDSYPTAPAPVTAVFAGLLTKVGIYAIIRTQTVLFPHSPLSSLLLVASLLTMVLGILGALAQVEIKRMLSFTLVSHLGYMVFGISLASQAGLAATIFYTAHHITIQAALFLVTGLIERHGGTSSLDGLGGLLKASPLLALLFFVPAMNLGGIPPLSGFLGKVGLLEAGAQVGGTLVWVVMAGGIATSLLTLMAMAKVWTRAFWGVQPERPVESPEREDDADEDDHRIMHPRMVLATSMLIVFSLLLTFFAGPLYAYSDRAAASIRAEHYVQAVWPAGLR